MNWVLSLLQIGVQCHLRKVTPNRLKQKCTVKKSTRNIVELFKLLVQNFNSTRILKFKVNYILNVIYIIKISNTNVIYITQISGRKKYKQRGCCTQSLDWEQPVLRQ